jgi:hypothetical protein
MCGGALVIGEGGAVCEERCGFSTNDAKDARALRVPRALRRELSVTCPPGTTVVFTCPADTTVQNPGAPLPPGMTAG